MLNFNPVIIKPTFRKRFNINNVVEMYMPLKFNLLKEDWLIDFLPAITKSKRDQEVMESWKKHFSNHNVPWAVTMKPGSDIMVLWKEDVT